MNPWWLRPPAEEGPAKQKKVPRPAAKTQNQRKTEPKDPPSTSDERPADRGRGDKRRRGRGGGGRRKTGPQRRVALLYEGAAAEPGVDLGWLASQLRGRGRIAAKRAYGDWQRLGDLRERLEEAGLEIIHLPPELASSPGSFALRLALDAIDLSGSAEPCELFVLVSVNPDLAPLVARLQEAGAEVIAVGSRSHASGALAAACDEYLRADESPPPPATPPAAESVDDQKQPVFALLVETIENLEAQGGGILWGSMVKQEMSRRQPGFDISGLGYSTFTDLLEDADRHEVIHLERDDRSGSYYVAGLGRE